MRHFKILLSSIATVLFVYVAFLLYDHFDPVDLSPARDLSRVVRAADGSWLYARTNREEKWRFPAELTRLDPAYLEMLLSFEDKRFYDHPGFDPLAMLRAVGQMLTCGRMVSGGSTITMQLARLLEPKPRTVISKLKEILRAFQLEWHYSKGEILSAYLTLTPYGGNVEGVVAASLHYFGKLPYALSASESALLVSLPQSPERNRPDRSPLHAAKARNKVLAISRDRGVISGRIYREAIEKNVERKFHRFPRYAPHLSQKLLAEKAVKNEITTTLDIGLQSQLEKWAKKKGAQMDEGTTLAVLVVRNDDASILAYLGSHDIFSHRTSGYVDMVHAVRSPGSTLKPFIYALGFEKHLVHPYTLILDRETRFGDYMPHNFSYEYSGEVTAAYALEHSLNIPAVKILQRITVSDFVERLRLGAEKVVVPKSRATLPVALGGIGIPMLQLTQLYTALANDGTVKRLHSLPQSESNGTQIRLFDTKAVRMVTAILRRIPPPEGFVDAGERIAYKTGTSYGYRDAWTFAYDKSHTVAVWVGKPNNAPQLRHTGRDTAAPLAFEVFSLLDRLLPSHLWGWPSSYPSGKVPPGLTYLDPREEDLSKSTLTMLYPQDHARFRSADCSETIIDVKVEDGAAPYYWYIDGRSRKFERSSFSLPFGEGAHTITVMDSKGEMITRDIWVDRPEC